MERNEFLKILKRHLKVRFEMKHYKFLKPDTLLNSENQILKVVTFQLEAHRKMTFTSNIALRPLFFVNSHFILSPGDRLGFFTEDAKDTWWSCNSEEDLIKSLDIVFGILEQKIFPIYDSINSASDFVGLYESGSSEFMEWASQNIEYYEMGLTYLKVKNNQKARELFEKCIHNSIEGYIPPFIVELREKCVNHINLINEKNQKEIDAILDKNTEDSKTFYKIK